ncbi:MAG: hypothetical protein CR986_05470 [Ignavibacteriae bacterium]|nr:MAG: hypothetical protein CR986_05470 [Ignavibacteriota bacterium]
MGKRPKIKPKLNIIDKILEVAGFIILVSYWIFIISTYSNLPQKVPIHYGLNGKPDTTGSKISFIILPILATILFIGLTILNNFPHIFNYLKKITEENALTQYTGATKLVRFIKTIILLMFGYISVQTYLIVTNRAVGLEAWFLPLSLALMFIPIIAYIYEQIKGKNK